MHSYEHGEVPKHIRSPQMVSIKVEMDNFTGP